MRYAVETEFIGHEYHIDVLDDTPVMGAEEEIMRKHINYGPYKTRRGAENALKIRKKFWQKNGFRRPPKGASLYDPGGNYMFNPRGRHPDHVTFCIEEKEISKKEIASSRT